MSNPSLFSRRAAASPTVPQGDVLGEYTSYLEAQKVVDRLAKADFAVKGMAIIGSDLMTVERVTGRLSYGRAALAGAASGSWVGLFFGLLLFLFSPAPEFSFIIAAAVIGAGFGMIFGIVSYAIGRRRRDFGSTHQVLAGSYRIIIDPNLTARARQTLAGGSTWPPPLPSTTATAPGATESGSTESDSAEPSTTESGSAEPSTTEPGDTDPNNAEPGNADPNNAETDDSRVDADSAARDR